MNESFAIVVNAYMCIQHGDLVISGKYGLVLIPIRALSSLSSAHARMTIAQLSGLDPMDANEYRDLLVKSGLSLEELLTVEDN